MPDPRKMLQRLEVATDTGHLPDDVAAWLRAGIADFQAGGSFDRGLSLKTNGVRAWENSARVRQRNQLLRQAADYVCEDPQVSDWERAGRLSKAVARFQMRTWPRLCHNAPPQPDAPTDDLLTHYLLLAHHAHPGDTTQFPSSQRHLYRLLT